jgi:Viral alkaline exonuclease
MAQLTPVQREIFKKYNYETFTTKINDIHQRLTREDILEVEMATRNQSENLLWHRLRLDRQTASMNTRNCGAPSTEAIKFGLSNEKVVKKEQELFKQICSCVSKHTNLRVKNQVLECGMFLSRIGLFSASPDAYLEMEDNSFVPIEIKCPHVYENVTTEDMRRTLGTKKERYRVKNTALSVNTSGSAYFVVEKKDPHYRQMQRQMYVMDALICVYVVKFKNSYVVSTVDRDNDFYLKELLAEKKLFVMFVKKNNARRLYEKRSARAASLECVNGLTEKQRKILASSGIHYNFGKLTCIYCWKNFDLDMSFNNIVNKHTCSDNSDDEDEDISINNTVFSDHTKRAMSLADLNLDVSMADQGVFVDPDNKNLKLFCCKGSATVSSIKHDNECNYLKFIKSI